MKNWSTNIAHLSKYPEKYRIWKLEQQINFGLDGEKISSAMLKQYLPRLTIDPKKKKYLESILS